MFSPQTPCGLGVLARVTFIQKYSIWCFFFSLSSDGLSQTLWPSDFFGNFHVFSFQCGGGVILSSPPLSFSSIFLGTCKAGPPVPFGRSAALSLIYVLPS
jgi:hypothetical protein